MPRDGRFYITLPLDIHRHPKLRNRSFEAKWTFVEMNIEARLAGNDGRFTQEDAEFLWPSEVLAELVASHPSRPVVVREGTDYVIREYAEHQLTTAEIERLAAVSRENGRKGGRPRKNPAGTQSKPGQVSAGSQLEPGGTQAKAESESESESNDFYSPSQSQSSNTRARISTDAIPISPMTKRLAGQRGITSLRSVVDAVGAHAGRTVDADQAYRLSVHLLDKAKTAPQAPQRYVLAAIERSSFEVQAFIDREVAS